MVFRYFVLVIASLATIFACLAIAVIVEPELAPYLAENFTGSGITVATIVLAIGTFWLVYATALSIHNQYEQEKRERKERLLREVRDWIFEIKNVTFVPITEDNMAFVQPNVSLRYGVVFNKVEYFEIAVLKILKDTDFKGKVSRIGEMMVAVMVFDRARYLSGVVDTRDFEAFPGYTRLKDKLLSEYGEKQVELRNTINEENGVISETNAALWDKYIRELANAESVLLSKLTDIESSLL